MPLLHLGLLHLGPAGDAFAGVFGGTAALLLVGGPVLLRWQRNRQQFALAQAALSQGITRFPAGPPCWLLSLRQGLTILTLGVALLGIGGVGCWFTGSVQTPTFATTPGSSVTPRTQAGAIESNVNLPMRPSPPAPNPALEEWHRLQSINTLGIMAVAAGVVLTLLGLVRVIFARTERRHFNEEAAR